MPIPLASHSISKVFVKFGNARSGASVSLFLSSSKAFCCAFPQTNVTFFLVNSLRGQAMVENFNFRDINFNAIRRHNKTKENQLVFCKSALWEISIKLFMTKDLKDLLNMSNMLL